MHFDVPKVVQSPGCDHGRDEESRNGRDVKIDILEAYVWISEWFRVKTGIYRSTGRLPEPPGSIMGLMGLSGKGGRAGQGGRAPLPPFPSPSRTRRRGGAPLSLSTSGNLVGLGFGGGILLPVGVGLPRRAPCGRPAPSPCS